MPMPSARRPFLLIAAIACAIVAAACAGESPTEPLRPTPPDCGGSIPGEFIVMLKAGQDLATVPDELAERHDFVVGSRWEIIHGFHAKNVADSAAIALEPAVSLVSPNQLACLAG
jgi:hypothetical protein